LGVTERRVRQLFSSYLRACGFGQEKQWEPRVSGGHQRREIPVCVADLWRKMLATKPPAPYGFAASEAHRRYGFYVDRATVRRWAILEGVAPKQSARRKPQPVRRWQCDHIGAIWQLDASPHRWFGPEASPFPLLEVMDDCSRVVTGARIYAHDNLMAYFDLLPRAFQAYGMPLALYVDYHSIFFSQMPGALTELGRALKFYEITFRYAPTPQAKGKIERQHQYWQRRLPAHFASEQIRSLEQANAQIEALRIHHNANEKHRELRSTPQAAWERALSEGRSQLRPVPASPWWPYVWSLRAIVRVGTDGRVTCGSARVKMPGTYRIPGTRILHCSHPDGSISLLGNTKLVGRPIVLYHLG
jgi:hypothetical protein